MHFTCWSLLYSHFFIVTWTFVRYGDIILNMHRHFFNADWARRRCAHGVWNPFAIMEADASTAFLFYCVSTGRHLGLTIRERGPWLFFIVRPLSLDDLLGSDNCINGEKGIMLNMHFTYWSLLYSHLFIVTCCWWHAALFTVLYTLLYWEHRYP